MFERYTEAARRVIFFGRYEASRLGAGMIDTEHLLLGIARQDAALLTATVGPKATEKAIFERLAVKVGDQLSLSVDMALTTSAKRVLAYTAEEADRLGNRHIGAEHLLLGLLREEGCEADRVLESLGADLARIREQIKNGTPAVYPEVIQTGTEIPYRAPTARLDPIVSGGSTLGLERYTEKARRSIFFARYEASEFGAEAIESEHLLLGIWREGVGLINDMTGKQDAWPELRERIEAHSPQPRKKVSTSVDMPLSDEVKHALAKAAEEMELRKGSQVGIDDLLLGLLQVEGCLAAELLRERGADVLEIRKRRDGRTQ